MWCWSLGAGPDCTDVSTPAGEAPLSAIQKADLHLLIETKHLHRQRPMNRNQTANGRRCLPETMASDGNRTIAVAYAEVWPLWFNVADIYRTEFNWLCVNTLE